MFIANQQMKHLGFSLGLILISMSAFGQAALFSGGAGDGHSQASYEQSQPIGNELFMGSSGDGHDFNQYTQNTVPDAKLFAGGIGDGYATEGYIQTTPAGFILYVGGVGDGADESSYEQDLTLTFGVFTGGIGDGYATSTYQQDQVLGADLYLGGTDDGHATSAYAQQPVTGFAIYGGGLGDGHAMDQFQQDATASFTLFYGGMGDGHDTDGYLQTLPVGTDLFAGGTGDGADNDDYEQGVIAVFGVYTGGEGDGADVAEYQQTDFIDALPIVLQSFTVELVQDVVNIYWTTLTETNNDYFLVERSNDLKQWIVIDSVDGAGNSNRVLEYKSVDERPRSTINYYRLKQVDYDGTSSYSMIRTVDLNSVVQRAELLVYPNPVRDRINLQFTGFKSNEFLLRIYDANGKLVYDKQLILPAGQGLYEINRTANMLQGYYIVIATDELNGESLKTRMLVK